MKYIKNYVIFSFDNPYQIHVAAKFYRHLDTLRAMGKISNPLLGTGMYEGDIEPVVYMDRNDFEEHILHSGYVNNQECFLILNPINPRSENYQGTLVYQGDKPDHIIGRVNQIKPGYEHHYNSWSRFNGVYWHIG